MFDVAAILCFVCLAKYFNVIQEIKVDVFEPYNVISFVLYAT